MLFDNIKRLCETRNITVAQLERTIHVGNGTLQKWKRVSPRADKLQKVASYFDVSIDFLLGSKLPSVQSQIIASRVDKLPLEKQDLVRRYIEVIQKE